MDESQQEEIKDSNQVAFFATAPGQSNLSDGEIIQFDTVLTNAGQGFNKYTGVFTAPVDGTYSFQTTILTDKDSEVWAYIGVNGIFKAYLNARGTDTRHGSGSQSLVITLLKGDQVTIRNSGNGGMIYGFGYTTFCGYLLF